ncbi:hypothetical protein PEDI_27840 [Persicobacter diffluens]|uniref:Uncharacterized protein n=1 Tax=Persicobacter diffluens TaxID=981 RepID=A0AAN5AKW4_9BACT|nr:hypothetical protein PEDI_27840 [Persicobacter diffluens]
MPDLLFLSGSKSQRRFLVGPIFQATAPAAFDFFMITSVADLPEVGH